MRFAMGGVVNASIYLVFYNILSILSVILWRAVERAEETTTYLWSMFCSVK